MNKVSISSLEIGDFLVAVGVLTLIGKLIFWAFTYNFWVFIGLTLTMSGLILRFLTIMIRGTRTNQNNRGGGGSGNSSNAKGAKRPRPRRHR